MGKIRENIICTNGKKRAEKLIEETTDKKPLFLCVGGTTETAKIPGLSMAGKNPEITDYTPTADLEIITQGKPITIEDVPATPQGIPTPALLTKSALDLAKTPKLPVNAGMKVKPSTPIIEVNEDSGNSILEKIAVKHPEQIYKNAEKTGKALAKLADYLIIGETTPGGTTTALGVLKAMGVNAENKISSSMPDNPHEDKIKTVKSGLKNSNLDTGDLQRKPMEAIKTMGDPMLPAVAGLASGSAKFGPTILAGGTQMTAVLKILAEKDRDITENISIWTTRWILEDKSSNIVELIKAIRDIPLLAVDIDLSKSNYYGLKAYEEGFAKEGVGAGGTLIETILKTKVNESAMIEKIEQNYEKLVK